MAWILNSLVHTLVVLGFLFVAWWSGNPVVAGLLILGAVLFFLRSINHPDYFLRRAMIICLNAGLAHITIFSLLSDFLGHISNEIARTIISAIVTFLEPHPWIGPSLIGFSLLFGVLEVARLKISKPGKQRKPKPHLQIEKVPSEIYDSETRVTKIEMVVIVRNPTSSAIDLTSPQIVRSGIWQRIKAAEMRNYNGEIVEGSDPVHTKTIPTGDGAYKLMLTAEFKWWATWRWVVSLSAKVALLNGIFGERRGVLRTTTSDASTIALLDVWPKWKL